MRIELSSIFVEDQAKALAFYTGILGFVKKRDIPLGEARWLTVVSPEGPGSVELVLEPNSNPVAKAYQQGIFAQGIPITAFRVTDIHTEYARLRERGVAFSMDPTSIGPAMVAILEDTCGNLIQIYQPLNG